MTSTQGNDQESALLTAALDHAWSRFNFRISSALQVLNYYLVSVAVLSAGYVAALTQGLNILAGMLGIIGSMTTLAAFMAGYRQIFLARLAIPQLRELEERIATLVSVPSIWAEEPRRLARRFQSGNVAGAMFATAFVGGLAAAVYAFVS